MIYSIDRTTLFKKDYKRIRKRGYSEEKFLRIVSLLAQDQPLPTRCRTHKLTGNWANHWECHIEPDWLLVYYYMQHTIVLVRTGTHADLFDT